MKAAVLVEYNQALTIEEVDLRPLGPSDVRIEIDASGVCHSDLNVWQGNVPFLRPPLILGHEGTGRVMEIGRDVWRVSVGDRVITSFVGACGYCWFCVRGDTHLCEEVDPSHTDTKGLLVSGSPVEALNHLGTFAEELVTDEKQVIPVQTDLPSDQLALIGCAITTGVGAVLNTARVEPGSTVTVIGAGGVGQAVVQGARIAGASRIFVVDPVEFKRSAALRHGATDVIDPADGDPVDHIRSLTAGRGSDYAFEVVGMPQTMLQALNISRRGGTTVFIGIPKLDAIVALTGYQLQAEGKRLMGSLFGSANVRRDFPRLIELAETGRLHLESMVSRHFKLDDVNQAFHELEAGTVVRGVLC